MDEREKELLEYLRENSGAPPTVREICSALGIKSTSTVHSLLHNLEEQGYINMLAGKRRTITLPGNEGTSVPILGRVAAGNPILATQEIEGYVTCRRSEAGLFALRVRGDSMIGAGIFEDDIVVVRPAPNAENGDIVVAIMDDEAVVKRLRFEKNGVALYSENPAYAPIRADNIRIVGRVISLIREY